MIAVHICSIAKFKQQLKCENTHNRMKYFVRKIIQGIEEKQGQGITKGPRIKSNTRAWDVSCLTKEVCSNCTHIYSKWQKSTHVYWNCCQIQTFMSETTHTVLGPYTAANRCIIYSNEGNIISWETFDRTYSSDSPTYH